jgi:manganese/zinc/iron transport system permease protein
MSTAAAGPLATVPRRPTVPQTQRALLAAYVGFSAIVATAGLEYVTRPLSPGEARDWAAPLWTMLVGITCSTSCAILGCYLVLRRMSLLGDAISHAVLPGIVLGYLFSGSLVGLPIFVGALAVGVLTSVLTQGISSLGRVPEDTSLGVVFTSLFAFGVVLISTLPRTRSVDLDIECVLNGYIDLASVYRTTIFGWDIPRALVGLVPALVITLALVLLFWKEFKIVAFDPALAAAMGFRVAAVHYLLMTMVAGVTVASFEAVGSILVVAMLVVPAATAALLSDRLGWMMAWAVALGATSAIFGYLLAAAWATSAAGMMAVMAGVQFAVTVLFAPRQGIVSQWWRNKGLAVRIAGEDILARLYRAEERGAGPATGAQLAAAGSSESTAGGWVPRWAAWNLRRRGWVTAEGTLTDRGRETATSLVRAHRLWESYLDTHFDLPRDHLHDAAERMEHFLGADLQDEIAAELELPALDPHGKAIPPSNPNPRAE